jgi:histidine ammonia-lyase
LQSALRLIRREAAFWDRDRAFAPDLARVRALVERGEFTSFVGATL